MLVTYFQPEPAYPQRILGPDNVHHAERSPGLHLTTVIRDIAEVAGLGKDSADQDDLEWYASGGWLWERCWDLAHKDAITTGTIINPGEFELDGIVGTPDRLNVESWELWELKCRWMSARKFASLERNFFLEIIQCKSYCKLVGTNVCNLCVFFVAGDWRPPVPQCPCVRLEFTDREIEENWTQVIKHSQKRGWL